MFNVPRIHVKITTGIIFVKKKSLINNIASQLYTHKCGFSTPYHFPRANGENVGNSLCDFIHDYGVPDNLTYDGAVVQVGAGTKCVDTIRRNHISTHILAPYRPNVNPAEGSIREVKKRWYRIQHKMNIPDRLWGYGITWICKTGNVTASSSRYADGRTPLEYITGETSDITEYLDFKFYDWVMYKSNAGIDGPELNIWLGVSHRMGPFMSYWILPASGLPISCNTVQHVTQLEMVTTEMKEKMKSFTVKVNRRSDSASADTTINTPNVNPSQILGLQYEDDDFLTEYNRVICSSNIPDVDDGNVNENVVQSGSRGDEYVGMEISLPRGSDGTLEYVTIKKRSLDSEGEPIGKLNKYKILNSREYEVEFVNGDIEHFTANNIAENLLAQVDTERQRQLLLDKIIDHRILKAVIPMSNGTFKTIHGTIRKRGQLEDGKFAFDNKMDRLTGSHSKI